MSSQGILRYVISPKLLTANDLPIRKPKTRRGKRILEKREPQLIEDTKKAIFLRAHKTSDVVKGLLKDLVRSFGNNIQAKYGHAFISNFYSIKLIFSDFKKKKWMRFRILNFFSFLLF
jgi:hypothetical protein